MAENEMPTDPKQSQEGSYEITVAINGSGTTCLKRSGDGSRCLAGKPDSRYGFAACVPSGKVTEALFSSFY